MTYRDGEDAQRARIEALERELDATKAKVALLSGEQAGTSPSTTLEHSRIVGGPSHYVREVVLPHGISERGYEAIADVLRRRLGLNAAQVGRSLSVPRVFTLTREDAGTRIRLEGDWRAMGTAVVVSSMLTGAFSAMVSAGVLADVLAHGMGSHHGMPFDAIETAVVVTLATVATIGSGWLVRRRASRGTTKQLADFDGTFEAILAIAAEQRDPPAPRARVEIADAASDEDESGATAARDHARR